jgi:hypothetical protein
LERRRAGPPRDSFLRSLVDRRRMRREGEEDLTARGGIAKLYLSRSHVLTSRRRILYPPGVP